jgi:hypothetical protein
MKKTVLITLIMLIVMSTACFAANGFAIGAEFAFDFASLNGYGAMLTLHLPQFPVMFGIGANISDNYFGLALNADWWIWQGTLVGILQYYVGLGLTAGIGLSNSAFFDLGVRLPLALRLFVIPPLELFLELAPAWIPIYNGINIAHFGLQSGLGFRIWF